MIKQIEAVIPPEKLHDKEFLHFTAAQKAKKSVDEIKAVIVQKRSIDARSRSPVFRILCNVFINELPPQIDSKIIYKPVRKNHKVIIVGFGPGGMFAALRLIELGIKPVIVERGKDVQTRRKDLKAIQQFNTINPDSNYCFGEGGAGTYSDGKLYTRSTKRGDVNKILNILIQHGAHPDISIDAHPHIGSNKLPDIVKAIRNTILNCGGEIYFNSRATDFVINNEKLSGVIVNNNLEITGDSVILAAGHSARDIYYILHNKNILLEPKPFAMGVRIEHPQSLINEIQYHIKNKSPHLPAATYNLSCTINERGIYSFCMCPGGIIIPAATSPGEIVVNGMSLSRRDSPFANSGFVVTVNEKDWIKYNSFYPFAGLKLQQETEAMAFEIANKTQSAPAQRMTDFIAGKISQSLLKTSYIPGLTSAPLHEVLPKFIVDNLKNGIRFFNKQMKGYYSEEAQLVAVESRTSSPVRIPRLKDSFMHPQIKGLFPCGEGAGYAGGIVSAAVDGENCANAAAKFINCE